MKKQTPSTRYSNSKFTHRLLAACFLAGSAIATTANAQQPTILATNQPFVENIIVDGSRVYWIRYDNSTVSSVDKINGGPVRTHCGPFTVYGTNDPASGGDIVQDNVNLYFYSNTSGPFTGISSTGNIYRVPKASSGATLLTNPPNNQAAEANPRFGNDGNGLGISNGWLYYFSGIQTIPPQYGGGLSQGQIERISTQGGAPQQLIPYTYDLNQYPPHVDPNHFSTDSAYLHWSNSTDSTVPGILRAPLIPGGNWSVDATASDPGAVSTPTTGPAGGYIFWEDTAGNTTTLMVKRPGEPPFALLAGVNDTGQSSFVQVGSFVFCITQAGTIVRVPINGGAPVVVVDVLDAFVPTGLTSDGTSMDVTSDGPYLYWAAAGDNSIRRVAIPTPPPTPTPTPTPTGPPIVTTNAATNVTSSSATLSGTVNPHGLATTVHFQYGTTTNYGSVTANQSFNGNNVRNVAANISGLSASTTYHFRIVATNSRGTNYSSDRTFTTLSATGSPLVATNPATLLASFSATLNGTVYPHGLTTTVYFQYGTTTSYGSTTTSQTKTGNAYQSVSANIGGLSASTTYHFRIVAHNSSGTIYGSDRTFTTLSATGPPAVITNPATNVASFSATLNGSADPHGLSTTVHFQYGTTTSYGSTTASQTKTGNTYQSVSANISGLSASTTYHFRIVASNSAGTTYGADRTFTTLSATGPPVVITNAATNVARSSATLNGSVDPHGLTTNVHFQYGTTTSYGSTTASQTKSGNTYQSVSANISGLNASATYHFRIVATNSGGTTYSGDRTFTTLASSTPTPTPTPTSSPCAVPPSGLVAWYAGDGNANDSQGSNNGTLMGSGTTFPVGEVGEAFSFSGSGYVSVNNSTSLNPSAMTIDAWVKATNSSNESSLVNKFQHNDGTSSDDSYYLGINPGGGPGKLRWQFQTPAGDFILDSPTVNIFDGQFHHVAGTYDGSLMIIYVDGQIVASRSANGAIQTTTTPVYLGAAIDNGATARYFIGQLDEIDIFNRALTQTEIQSIFNAGGSGKCH